MKVDVKDILKLTTIPGIGAGRIRNIVNYFKDTSLIFSAGIGELTKIEGIDKKLAKIIIDHRNTETRFVDEQLKKAEKVGARIISFWDDEYPEYLRKIYDPPVLLFVRGEIKKDDNYSIAVVGTRKPTAYGKYVAEKFTTEIVRNWKLTIVSGFARGIDTIAHISALKSGGRTIAVLGSGVDVIYPPENRRIVEDVISNGAIISEFPMGTKPDAMNFPRRNRIISGISMGVLIVETDTDGGAMITAQFALDQNREVFAVPGNINQPKSNGTNFLIKEGRAKLVQNIDDIIDEIKYKIKPVKEEKEKPKIELNMFESKIIEVLSETEPMHIDKIAELSGLSVTDCLVHLLELEFKDLVKQLPGKFFVKKI